MNARQKCKKLKQQIKAYKSRKNIPSLIEEYTIKPICCKQILSYQEVERCDDIRNFMVMNMIDEISRFVQISSEEHFLFPGCVKVKCELMIADKNI